MTQQRFRIWFRKGERVRYISHLDVLRSWERAIRRAGLPLSYSQGFTPHPKLAFAGPLPLGFTSEAEVMDVTLDERVSASEFESRLVLETTEDLAIVALEEVPLSAPQPQSSVMWADYTCDLPGVDPDTAISTVNDFLAKDDVPWTEERKEKTRQYNLRAMVASLTASPTGGGTRLTMRLSTGQEATGRPEQVVAALFPGVEPNVYTRTAIILNEPSPAREAWRRKGQYVP
ncbi:MAG: TIGR03936 family radical SAM-associated protein [Dehalococcoidia bacterium]|nr:TIGR03936 family radical SAM-associated protein [Dehalococcoidia bacterium]